MGNLSRRSVLRSSLGFGRGRDIGAALHRKCRRDDRDGVVGAGLRPGRGRGVQEDRRRLPKGQRQHARLQHHSLCAGAAEDRLGGDERRRPGSVPEQSGRNHCALRLGRQAGRCQRRRRDAEGGVHRDRVAQHLLLQQRRRRSAAFTACPIRPRYCRTMSGNHWSRRRGTRSKTSRRPGTPTTISSRRCRRSCANSMCATSMGSVFR